MVVRQLGSKERTEGKDRKASAESAKGPLPPTCPFNICHLWSQLVGPEGPLKPRVLVPFGTFQFFIRRGRCFHVVSE
jgi:hypothetical protein